jgi:hypothetical protein
VGEIDEPADDRIACRLDPEPHQLEEARVDDLALVDGRRAAVADVIRRPGIRVAVLREPQVVRLRRVGAVLRGRPALDLVLPVVGGLLVRARRSLVAVLARDVGGASARRSRRDGRRE